MPWLTEDFPSLRYQISGSGSQTLLLCHELGGSLESFDGVIARVAPHFRILAWDQCGAGLSEKPVAPYTMQAHANDLARLVTHLKLTPPYLLCGVAAGSAIALLFAQQFLAHDIAGALLCSPSLGVDAERRDYLLQRAEKARQFGVGSVVDAVLARSYPPEIWGETTEYSAYRSRFLSNDPVAYALANEALSDFEASGLLAEIDYPVNLLAGDDDRLRPPAMIAKLRDAIPRATMSVVSSGHLMSVQAPGAVAAALLAMRGASD